MPSQIEWHHTIDTTMRRAADLADEGCPSGTIVAAGEQTAGLGRQGRHWYSPPGTGLYFTQILRIALPPQQLPIVTLALGLAVADAVQLFTGLTCDLRWPNDVMVGDRKLAGILTVLHQSPNGQPAILAGVGLNVNQPDFPHGLHEIATSIALETGTSQDPQFLLRALEGSIRTHVDTLLTSGSSAILRLFAAQSSYVSGRRVAVDLPGGTFAGTTAGLTPNGFLILRKDDGEEVTLTAGGVRAAYPPTDEPG